MQKLREEEEGSLSDADEKKSQLEANIQGQLKQLLYQQDIVCGIQPVMEDIKGLARDASSTLVRSLWRETMTKEQYSHVLQDIVHLETMVEALLKHGGQSLLAAQVPSSSSQPEATVSRGEDEATISRRASEAAISHVREGDRSLPVISPDIAPSARESQEPPKARVSAVYSGWSDRELLKKQWRAASLIAAIWRGYKQRQIFKDEKTALLTPEANVPIKIQTLQTTSGIRSHDWQSQNDACIQIQRFVRGRQSRKSYLQKLRMKEAECQTAVLEDHRRQQDAALLIQCLARRYIARQLVGRLLQPYETVVRITKVSSFTLPEVVRGLEWQISLTLMDATGNLKGLFSSRTSRFDRSRVVGQAFHFMDVRRSDKLDVSLRCRLHLQEAEGPRAALAVRDYRVDGEDQLVCPWIPLFKQSFLFNQLRSRGGRVRLSLVDIIDVREFLKSCIAEGRVAGPLGLDGDAQSEEQAALDYAMANLPSTLPCVYLEISPLYFHDNSTLRPVYSKAHLLDAPVFHRLGTIQVGAGYIGRFRGFVPDLVVLASTLVKMVMSRHRQ